MFFRNKKILKINNKRGSIQHYYHFIYGFLFPLINYVDFTKKEKFVIRSCGPFNKIIHEIFENYLVIADICDFNKKIEGGNSHINMIDGYDHPDFYDSLLFKNVVEIVKFRLHGKLEKAISNISNVLEKDKPFFLFIDRGDSSNFYNSPLSEIPTSANQRRSIPNFINLVKAFDDKPATKLVVYLEEMPFVEQIALFSKADIVVAQHGAALANLAWGKPGLRVIEILPECNKKDPPYFAKLSEIFNFKHIFVFQDDPHSKVDPELVVGAFHKISHTIRNEWIEQFYEK